MFQTFVFNINFYLTSLEELLFIWLLFSLIQSVLLCSIIELIWPTHFFNKRHNINFQILRHRTYTECFLKLRTSSTIVKYFTRGFFKNFKF